MKSRLGVLGWPVAHSRSPAMHNAALAALGLDGWRYQRLPVPPALFAQTVSALGQSGFLGANVTIPHKQAALALATEASPTARAIGAANTLTFATDGAIVAENTDAPGLIAALDGLTDMPAHPRVLVLGAGGSARAVAWALRERDSGVEPHVRARREPRGGARSAGGVRALRSRPAGQLHVRGPAGGRRRRTLGQ
jgi:shikimate dehydrogenase